MDIISRAEAKALGLKRYFTGVQCKHGHVCERTIYTGCLECKKQYRRDNIEQFNEYNKQYKKDNIERLRKYNKQYGKQYHKDNQARLREYAKQYRKDNPEKCSGCDKKYREENSEKVAEYAKQYRKDNLDKHNARNAKRRAAKLERTPSWLTDQDEAIINYAFRVSHRLGEILEVQHSVDHIIPLQGKKVSGLHVPGNLQVMPSSDNSRKHNKYDIDELCI